MAANNMHIFKIFLIIDNIFQQGPDKVACLNGSCISETNCGLIIKLAVVPQMVSSVTTLVMYYMWYICYTLYSIYAL